MSKRPDDPDAPEMDEGMTTAERRRRKRRGGGLRVPSDNVPRRTQPQPVAPVPEDPALAVSIAYSFGSDASQPVPRAESARGAEAAPGASSAPDSFAAAEAEAAKLMADEPVARGGLPMTAAAMAASAATPQELHERLADVGGEGDVAKTREMPAIQLEELGLEVPEFLADGGDTVVATAAEAARPPADAAVPEAVAATPEPPAVAVPTAAPVAAVPEVASGPAAGSARTHTVTLSDDDLEELVEEGVLPAGLAAAAKAAASGASVPHRLGSDQVAPFDEHSSPSLPVVRLRAATTPPPPPLEPAREPEPAAAPPAVAAAVPVPVEVPQAVTDEPGSDGLDIEIEAGGEEPEAEAPAPTPEAPRRRAPTGEREKEEELALDDADLQDELAQPADASDSGEILTDELIEEVDAQSAQAVPIRDDHADARDGGAAAAPAAAAPPADAPTEPPAAPAPASAAPPPAVAKTPPAPPPAAVKPPPAPPRKPSAARVAAVAAAVGPERKDGARGRARPWFEEIFDDDYLRTLPFLTPQATQAEAQFVIDALGLQPGAQVLDLGCGYGRHAMELAARGYHMVGLDLSLPLLLRGADEAQRRSLTINFIHGDMRELDFDAQFDGAYCVFSTFGFFDDETNKKTAINLGRALKPGARVVLDILNRDYLIADLPTRVWWEGDGCVVLEEVEFNYFSSRIQCNRSVVFDDGRQVEQEISMRAYSLHEIGKLLHAAGFRVLEISGSMATRGRFFGSTSRQIIVVAERRPRDPAKDSLPASKDAPEPKSS